MPHKPTVQKADEGEKLHMKCSPPSSGGKTLRARRRTDSISYAICRTRKGPLLLARIACVINAIGQRD
jgi:hypothetical protein